MRAPILLGAVAVVGMWATSGSALAQRIYVDPDDDEPYYSYAPSYGYAPTYQYAPAYQYAPPAAPRVYGYRSGYYGYGPYGYGPAPLPHPRGGCGTYRFWDGYQCVDARRK